MQDQTTNIHPHREARLAIIVWGKEYSEQRGGSMDFWDCLDESRKRLCREWCNNLDNTDREIITAK